MREKNASLRTGQAERANKLRDYLGSLVKGDSPRCGEMSKGSLEKGAGREFASGLRDYLGSLVKGAVIEDD